MSDSSPLCRSRESNFSLSEPTLGGRPLDGRSPLIGRGPLHGGLGHPSPPRPPPPHCRLLISGVGTFAVGIRTFSGSISSACRAPVSAAPVPLHGAWLGLLLRDKQGRPGQGGGPVPRGAGRAPKDLFREALDGYRKTLGGRHHTLTLSGGEDTEDGGSKPQRTPRDDRDAALSKYCVGGEASIRYLHDICAKEEC